MRKTVIQLLFVIGLILKLTSCVTTHQINYLQTPKKNFIPAYKDTFTYKDYRLKEGDRLSVQVYSIDDQTNALFNGSSVQAAGGDMGGSSENLDLYTYMVQSNGTINLPIVNDVAVKGKTLRQTKEIIENAIKPVLKVNSVDVRLIGRSFSIIGAGKSGKFPFPREKVNIYQALALSGDFGIFTDRSKIRILRVTDKGNVIKTFDVRSADIINSEFYYLEPDDVIFIQPMDQQFFGSTTIWSTLSTLITTVSFGAGIYTLLKPVPVVK